MLPLGGCSLSAKVAEALKPKSGFRLHAAKVTSLACNGPAQMKSFYLIRFSPTTCMIGSNRSAGDI